MGSSSIRLKFRVHTISFVSIAFVLGLAGRCLAVPQNPYPVQCPACQLSQEEVDALVVGLESRARIYDVHAFGAVGDDNADDTVAVATAIRSTVGSLEG